MKKLGFLGRICQLIAMVAAIDWGLIALFNFNLVTKVFGNGNTVRIVYIVFGVAGAYLLVDLILSRRR
jgi:uncharacterized protein